MGRPAKHTADDFIDAAIALFARAGIRAVTLGAVAAELGAANGSIYHRFPDRPALLAAMWTRTARRFEAGHLARLGEPTVESAIDTAVWFVEWCRDNLDQAQVLCAGMRAFGPDDWSVADRAAADRDASLAPTLDALRSLAGDIAASEDQVVFAVVELPAAVVRGPLEAGRPPGAREAELIRSLATLILTQPSSGERRTEDSECAPPR